MTLSSLTSALLLALLALVAVPAAVAAAFPDPAAAREPKKRAERKVTVTGAVNVGRRTRAFGGVNYRLLAFKYDWRSTIHVTDSTFPVWLLNGQRAEQLTRTVDAEDWPKGKRPHDIVLMWVSMPDGNRLEVIHGLLNAIAAPKDPADWRQWLIDQGYVPFEIEVDKIPVVSADLMEELSRKIEEHFPTKRGEQAEGSANEKE